MYYEYEFYCWKIFVSTRNGDNLKKKSKIIYQCHTISSRVCVCLVRNVSYKKLLEYLFWMWDPSLTGGAHEPERILEEGFMDAETYMVGYLKWLVL